MVFLTTSLIFTISFSFFYFFYAQILHFKYLFYLNCVFFGGINILAPILMYKIFKLSIHFSEISFSCNIACAITGSFTP
ncbi:hypothetical protein A0068_05120 [Campylobacter lari]|nr:hypothetical protein [Campylobacter lari]